MKTLGKAVWILLSIVGAISLAAAVSLAVGMSSILSNIPGMKRLMPYWFNFALAVVVLVGMVDKWRGYLSGEREITTTEVAEYSAP